MTHPLRDYFAGLRDALMAALHGDETFTCAFDAEQSEFVRFNHGRVRQAGHVKQAVLVLRLIARGRQASAECSLSGQMAEDLALIHEQLRALRDTLDDLPEDPLLSINREPHASCDIRASSIPPGEALVEQIVDAAGDQDLVGFLASGPVLRGFATSLGQFNWHEVENFNFEWSLYHEADKATKHSYAGLIWDEAQFKKQMARAQIELELLRQPSRRLDPGDYRVFLAPAALSEIMQLLSWDGFSEKKRGAPARVLCNDWPTGPPHSVPSCP